MISRSFLCRLGFLCFASLRLVPGLSAATLVLDSVERVDSIRPTPVDLTTEGTLDWAYWAPNSAAGITPPVPPTNSKLIGTAIGDLEPVGGTTLRGSATATTALRYSYTDGTSPTAATNASLGGLIFNSDLGANANGKGVQLSIAGDPAVERIVTLYLGGFAATGNLTLTLNGVQEPVTDSGQVFISSSIPKHMVVYTLRFRPDSPTDLLQVQWTASNITDNTNSHVGLQAVTVALIPEPGTAALAAFAALILHRRRRAA